MGFEYEITSDGVSFSRSDTAVEEYDPATRIGAAPFLELTGTAEVGSLDQVIDVSDFKSLNRCLVLVCPKSKVKGAKSTYYKFCANPSKFQVNARHFCGVHKLTFQNHPDALKEGRIFDCETDVVVCSRVHGMGLAYSLEDAHVKDHCERGVGEMELPFNRSTSGQRPRTKTCYRSSRGRSQILVWIHQLRVSKLSMRMARTTTEKLAHPKTYEIR